MTFYRERKRAIMKAVIKEFGVPDAYDVYNPSSYRHQKCVVCQADVHSYSEWHETGYETEGCSNGCWLHEVYGLTHELETKGFSYRGKYSEKAPVDFEKAIERYTKRVKHNKKLFYRKKKSQQKNKWKQAI
ncbi:MAG: hypothetical protein ABS938_15510 [Psychrobacillus psychrodurans]